MKQDYLWDKTGEDAEIEKLENALAVFRYKETAPPAFQPAKVVPFKQFSPRRSFRLVSAIAACAAFAMIGSGFWYEFSTNQIETREMLVATIEPQTSEPRRENPFVEINDNSSHIQAEKVKQIPARRLVHTSKTVLPGVSPKPKKIKNIEPENVEARLTKEEKYAYDQLMLALSITSSKLKMVKDKVENSEEQTTVRENGR